MRPLWARARRLPTHAWRSVRLRDPLFLYANLSRTDTAGLLAGCTDGRDLAWLGDFRALIRVPASWARPNRGPVQLISPGPHATLRDLAARDLAWLTRAAHLAAEHRLSIDETVAALIATELA